MRELPAVDFFSLVCIPLFFGFLLNKNYTVLRQYKRSIPGSIVNLTFRRISHIIFQ